MHSGARADIHDLYIFVNEMRQVVTVYMEIFSRTVTNKLHIVITGIYKGTNDHTYLHIL